MTIHNTRLPILIAATFLLALSTPAARAQPAAGQPEPDNTKTNKRDRNPSEATADRHKMNSADLGLSAKIRKAVMAEKSLSTYAHNVKIISQDGIVTLKGPVRSAAEVKSIVALARASNG